MESPTRTSSPAVLNNGSPETDVSDELVRLTLRAEDFANAHVSIASGGPDHLDSKVLVEFESNDVQTTAGPSASQLTSKDLHSGESAESARAARIRESMERLWPDRAFRPEQPQEFVEREREFRRMVRVNSERKVWGKVAPRRYQNWNDRHQLKYTNDGLQQNIRSYFDRWIDYRQPGDPSLGVMLPSWRLSTQGSTPDERRIARDAIENFSASYLEPIEKSSTPPPSRRPRVDTENVFERLYADSAPSMAAPSASQGQPRPAKPTPGGGGDCVTTKAASTEATGWSNDSSTIGQSNTAASQSMTNLPIWDERHHIGWNNELDLLLPYRSTRDGASRRLLQQNARAYFDRPRTLQVKRSTGPEKQIPSWRLEPFGASAAALTSTFRSIRADQKGIIFGNNFIQIGNFRLANIDGRHFSIAHQGNDGHMTVQIFKDDGTVRSGPCADQQAFGRMAGPPHGIHFGDAFMQLGPWRIADVDGDNLSIACESTRQTAIVYASDGRVYEGPRQDWQSFDRGPAKPKGIYFGDHFIDIGNFRFTENAGEQLLISHMPTEKVIMTYQQDGTNIPGSNSAIPTNNEVAPAQIPPIPQVVPAGELRSECRSFLNSYEDVEYHIISDVWGWDSPVKMERMSDCHKLTFSMNKDKPEFQILLNGQFDKRIHPAARGCIDASQCRTQGPHKRGKGYNWIIDWGREGKKATITVKTGETGWISVNWARVAASKTKHAPSASELHPTISLYPGGGGGPSPQVLAPPPLGPPDTGRGLTLTREAEERRKKWQPRSHLVFKNEEVSRLDRSYFDRFREPDALLSQNLQAKTRGSTLVWSLEKIGSPEEDAKEVWASQDARAKSTDGRWNSRHHITFQNQMRPDLLLNPNYRCYFDRHREVPEHSGAPLPPEDFMFAREGEGEDERSTGGTLEAPGLMNLSRVSEPTESRLRAKRSKLSPSERLEVDWKLGDKKMTLEDVPFSESWKSVFENKMKIALETEPRERLTVHNRNNRELKLIWNDQGRPRLVPVPDSESFPLQVKAPKKQLGLPAHNFSRCLRESRSDGSLATRQRQKRREAWFSGHSIHF